MARRQDCAPSVAREEQGLELGELTDFADVATGRLTIHVAAVEVSEQASPVGCDRELEKSSRERMMAMEEQWRTASLVSTSSSCDARTDHRSHANAISTLAARSGSVMRWSTEQDLAGASGFGKGDSGTGGGFPIC